MVNLAPLKTRSALCLNFCDCRMKRWRRRKMDEWNSSAAKAEAFQVRKNVKYMKVRRTTVLLW